MKGNSTEEISKRKKELRKICKAQLSALDARYKKKASERIIRKIQLLCAYKRAHTVFCFVGRDEEIDTTPLIEAALDEGKRVCVPRCKADGEMDAVEIRSLSELTPRTLGILEPPADFPSTLKKDIDLAVIPCLTANLKGDRLGFGGGYYDRYLADAAFETVLICYETMLSEDIPVSETDVRISYVLTD